MDGQVLGVPTTHGGTSSADHPLEGRVKSPFPEPDHCEKAAYPPLRRLVARTSSRGLPSAFALTTRSTSSRLISRRLDLGLRFGVGRALVLAVTDSLIKECRLLSLDSTRSCCAMSERGVGKSLLSKRGNLYSSSFLYSPHEDPLRRNWRRRSLWFAPTDATENRSDFMTS
jgi:hypothetical protein